MKSLFSFIGVFLCLVWVEAGAQSHVIVGTDASAYPSVVSRAYGFAANGASEVIVDGSIALSHDGNALPVTATAEPTSTGRGLSVVVMVDVSASMSNGSPTSLDLAKGAASVAPPLLNTTSDEIALGMFDRNATLLHGLTSDKTSYSASISELRAGSGSDLNAGLLAIPMGALIHVQNARFSRAIILLVDGTSAFNYLNALQLSIAFRTQVYVIGLRATLSQELKDLADSSGGIWVENISTQANANSYMQAFVSHAKRLPAALLSFTSPDNCGPTHIAAFKRGNLERTTMYSVPVQNVPALEWSTSGLDYGSEGQGGDLTVRITARGKAVTINGSNITDAAFVIMTPIAPNTVLQPDQSRDITIRFTGAASSHFATLTLTSTACDVLPLYLRGGKQTAGATLRLVKPNGGETFVAGMDTTIAWTNTIPEDLVRLEVSADGGATWNSITEAATGNSYTWNPGPATTSNALVRVQRTVIDPTNIVELEGHRGPLYACDLNAAGVRAITGGDDGTVRVWNAITGVEERLLGTHQGWVWCVATHPVQNIAVSGGYDGTVRVWDLVSGDRIATIKTDRVWSVAFNGDGTKLAIGAERSLTILNTSDWSNLPTIAIPGGPVYSCAFSNDNSILVTAENDKVVIRDGQTFEVLKTLSGHVGPVYAVAATPDGSTVMSGGADFVVRLWDASTGQQTGLLPPATAAILSLDVAYTGARLLVGGGDGTAKIYQLSDLTLLSALTGHQGLVYCSRFDSDATHVITASTDAIARVWNLSGASLTSDISDARFSIIGGTATVTNVDHGTVPLNSGNERTTKVIRNSGSDPLVIRSARIVSGDVESFSLLSSTTPVIVAPGADFAIESAFAPQRVGSHSASLQVTTGTGVSTVPIAGVGSVALLDVPSVIDFGRHLANQTVIDTTIIIRAPQQSGTINITRTTLVGPQAGTYSIVSGGGAFAVSAVNPHEIKLRFEPITFGHFAARIELTLDNGTTSVVRIYGDGTGDARIARSAQSLLFTTNRCNSNPTEESVTFTNNGTSTLQIYVASISGANQSEFTVIEPTTFPVDLDASQSATFKVRFTPVTPGTKEARLVVSSNAVDAVNGVTTVPLIARKDSVYFELSRTVVDFRNVNEGESSTQILNIINSGTVALRWENTPIDLGDFRIESIFPPVTQPGSQSEITLKFKGGVVGQNYNASYTFVDSVCSRNAQLQMTASVRSYIGCTLSIDTVHALIGSTINVPIRIRNKVNFDRTSVNEINVRLRVNGSILTPGGSIDKGTFANGIRTFNLTVPIPESGEVAMSIPFDVTWGNDTASFVTVDSAWTADTIQIRTQNGLVYLDNLCKEGGPRLLLRTGQSPLSIRVAPQPVADDAVIELNVLERGPTSLILVDLTGREIMSVVEQDLHPGSYLLPLDVTTLENGAYTLLLTTRTQRISQRISVVR